MAGGSRNYAEMYAKYKQGSASDSDFEKYVDSQGDLKAAWKKIQSDPNAWDSEYWIKRGATSKAAFGRAHAAEDAALYTGTYQGATDYTKGSDAWKRLFGGKTGTRFDKWYKNKDKDKDSGGKPKIKYPWDDPENKTNVFHPMLVPDYEAPEAHSMFGAEYQPWSQASVDDGYVPENVWNYAPPQLTVGRPQWGANPMGPLSEQPWIDIENAKKAAAAKAAASQSGTGPHGAEGTSFDDEGYEIMPNGTRTGMHISQMDPLGIGDKILGWMGADSAGVQRAKAFAREHGIDPDVVGGGVADEIATDGPS